MIVPIIPYPNTFPSLLLAMPKWTMQNMIRNCSWNSGPRKSVWQYTGKSRALQLESMRYLAATRHKNGRNRHRSLIPHSFLTATDIALSRVVIKMLESTQHCPTTLNCKRTSAARIHARQPRAYRAEKMDEQQKETQCALRSLFDPCCLPLH